MNPAPWRNCCASMMSLMMSSTSSSSPSEFQPTIADSSSDDSLTQSVLRNFLEKTWPSEAKRSEPSVMISLHSAHRALLVLARSIWVISGRSVGLHFRAVVCAQVRQASRHYSPHSFGEGAMRAVRVARRWQGRLAGRTWRCAARGAGLEPLSGWHTGFEIPIGVDARILPMILPAGGVISSLAVVSSVMGAAT